MNHSRKRTGLTYMLSILLVECSGFVVGILTRPGTEQYATSIIKPPLAPPGILFPIAWTILYGLMGFGLARMILSSDEAFPKKPRAKKWSIILFAIQITLNLAWCFIFFTAEAYLVALIELILMLIAVVMMTVTFMKVNKVAGLAQLPYIIWLCFAAYLNAGTLVMN